MIVLGLENHSGDFCLERLVNDVVNLIGIIELGFSDALQDRIQLFPGIVLMPLEAVLQGNPLQFRIFPDSLRSLSVFLHDVEQTCKDMQDSRTLCVGYLCGEIQPGCKAGGGIRPIAEQ
ncbi:hypothetical protein ES703_117077 [subsurface metagenome]